MSLDLYIYNEMPDEPEMLAAADKLEECGVCERTAKWLRRLASREQVREDLGEQTSVIGFGLHWPNTDRCHVTVQTPAGDQFYCGAMNRGETLECAGVSVTWGEGPSPKVSV